MVAVRVEGLNVLVRDLTREVPESARRTAIALGEVGERTADRMRQIVPVDDGDLLDSITSDPRPPVSNLSVEVGPDKAANDAAWRAHFTEYGVGAHAIRARAKRALTINGGLFTRANHPGHGPKPFAGPAADWAAGQLPKAIRDVPGL